MGEKIEVLEHHAHFHSDFFDVFKVIGQFDIVDNDLTALVLFESIDAADQSGFPRTGRAADNDPFPSFNGKVDLVEHMQVAKPLVQPGDLDDRVAGGFFLRVLVVSSTIYLASLV